MKTIEKTCTIYQSFDGKEFMDEKKCAEYEASKVSEMKVNLRNFTIEFPMQDSFTSCRAFLVKSENEFEMFEAYIFNEYSTIDVEKVLITPPRNVQNVARQRLAGY